MNWLTKIKTFGDKIKRNLQKKFPTKEEIANSDWTSCCKGPILKKDLEENLWVCKSCGKHHRISCRQRFDIFFGKNKYEIIETPIPSEDPLNWIDTKSYKERLIQARKKTSQNCAVMIAKGQINDIQITAGAINFVQLLSPTTSNERMKKIIKDSHDMIYYISMLSTTGGKLKVPPKKILENYKKIKKINKNKNCVIGFGITNKTIKSFRNSYGVVVGSEICKEITRSLNNRQNPVTNVSKMVKKMKNKIL